MNIFRSIVIIFVISSAPSLFASESLNNFAKNLYLLKAENPAIVKTGSALSLGLSQSKSTTDFTYDLNGEDANESYTQEQQKIDLAMVFATNEIGAQIFVSRNNYTGLFLEDEYEETLETYDILTSIQMNLVESLFIGFSMNWEISSGDIYGGDVGTDNELGVRERLTQMATGLNYDNGKYSLGLFYAFLGKR